MAANKARHEGNGVTFGIASDVDADDGRDDEPLLVIDLRDDDIDLDGAVDRDQAEGLDQTIDLDEVLPEDAGVIAKICMLDDLVREGIITEADRANKKAELLGRR